MGELFMLVSALFQTAVPGPQKSVKQWPKTSKTAPKAHISQYFWGPGRRFQVARIRLCSIKGAIGRRACKTSHQALGEPSFYILLGSRQLSELQESEL